MSVRETVNQNPAIVTIATIVVIAAVVLTILWQSLRTQPQSTPPVNALNRAFFTTDDGVTWFADDLKRIPPFEVDGKIAVRCQVFAPDGPVANAKPFVGYLERYRPEQKAAMEEIGRSSTAVEQSKLIELRTKGLEVKAARSTATDWVLQSDPAGAALIDTLVNQSDPAGRTVHRVEP